MSKSTNGLGQFRGKLGGVVYAVRNGQQVIRTYQPVVANPKSEEQRLQRAKGVLAGKLSHLITASVIVGMNGGSKSGRRAMFNKYLLNSIVSEIASTTGNAKATLVPDLLLLSNGPQLHAISRQSSPITLDSNTLNIRWNDGGWKGEIRLITLVSRYNDDSKQYDWHLFEAVVDVAEREHNITLPSSFSSGTQGDVFSYAIPIIINSETLVLNGSPLASTEGAKRTTFIANLVATDSSAISYAESELVAAEYVTFG